MNNLTLLINELLMEQISYDNFIEEIESISVEDNRQQFILLSCKRLARSYKNMKNDLETIYDFCCNVRNYILFSKQKIKINSKIAEYIDDITDKMGLDLIYYDNVIEVDVVEKNIFNKEYDKIRFYKTYDLEVRRNYKKQIGDYFLHKMSGFYSYSSLSQKTIINYVMNQETGTTILGCMPTGMGKSIVAYMPSYYESCNLSIVVVPTVALAIDQAQSAMSFFGERAVCFFGEMEQDKRYMLLNKIKKDEVTILFISPEALLNGAFHELILQKASEGKVSRLVIDEAHLVADWGTHFRTEFQLLSIFRKKLLQCNDNKLKTILLSATLDEESTELLKKLFSEGDNFIELRGDMLRYEHDYFLVKFKSQEDRIKYIIKNYNYFPRPNIIYVKTPNDAIELKEKLCKEGFRCIEVFTGKTDDQKREEIIKKWNNNDIDTIIATSAFGMGVDKGDIRCIVHCYIPESISRFIQEVGRSGRDGLNAISILCVEKQSDFEYINYLTRSKVLTVDKIVTRWNDILNNYSERLSGDTMIAYMDAKPYYLYEEETGKINAAWNEYVILLLYKYGLIDLIDISLDRETRRHKITIKIKNIQILSDCDKLREFLEPIRDFEREKVDNQVKRIKDLIQKYDKCCWGDLISKEFFYSKPVCSGCPACQGKNKNYVLNEVDIVIKGAKNNFSLKLNKFLDQLDYSDELVVEYSGTILNYLEDENKLRDLVNVIDGIDNLLIPDDLYNFILKYIDRLETKWFYNIWTYSDLLNDNIKTKTKVWTIIFKEFDKYVYNKIRELILEQQIKVVYIVPDDFYISNCRRLKDTVDTFVINI